MKAKIRENVRELYLKGRDATNPDVLYWAESLAELAGFELPLLGAFHEIRPDQPTRLLVVLDVSNVPGFDDVHDLYIEPELIEITDATEERH